MSEEKKDYSKTVNLPQTDFPMKANLPQREPQFLQQWEKLDLYAKMRSKNSGGKKFILHDGPPYANGHIHLGTSLNKILKDIIVKHNSMAGSDSPYTPGWDCHGLPIEQQCMKEMKVDKHHVNRVEFRKQAAAFAARFIEIQRSEFKRLGVLADWHKPYLTMDPKYESAIIRVFGALAREGYIFRQKKPVYWCPTCETAMADAEVEYAEHISHSVYVKFTVTNSPVTLSDAGEPSVVIWTTTPWTLPANVALAFQPQAQYVNALVVLKDGSQQNLVLAKRLLPVFAEKIGAGAVTIVHEYEGSALEGIKCKNPLTGGESVGVLADYVTLEDGTGVVHIAPGHGQEDYQVGLSYKLPILSPVNDKGIFTDEAPEFLRGHKVFAANQLIIDELLKSKALLFEHKFAHSYPHCWRCKKAIIFRATPQWFMSVEHKDLRKRLLETVKNVRWVPAYGENRMAGMLQTRPDWCLSRQRLWGVPVPVFYCEKCGEPLLDDNVIGHVAALFAEHGSDIWFEKTPQQLLASLDVKCSKCKNDTFRKEEDILDVWFDSGVSSEAVLASGNFPGLSWPADMYLEGSDQHRGWFQTSLLPAVALRGQAPYKSVLTHGFVVDGEGKKMSKSLGNVILPEQIISSYGADILRLWTATSDYREDIRISPEIIKGLTDTYRKVRNTIRFLLGNIFDFSPEGAALHADLREIDRHALWQLQVVVSEVTGAYNSYEFHRAAVSINNFCAVYLSGFYLDALKDTLYCDAPAWPSRRSAQAALREICLTLARLISPILSFTAEETWQELRKKDASLAESVFLSNFPVAKNEYAFTGALAQKWEKLFALRASAQAAFEVMRQKKEIGSNLGAHVELHLDDAAITGDRELLSMALGTWDVTVSAGSENLAARASSHPKCGRCWRHTDDVTTQNPHGDALCARCISALKE
ncbi:MAG: isoleucine--tRNA ligase [Elusimicrobia bacterium RIFOXYB2_FULL_50_12]|nr:MAG: isoleucine--tRNA ligase [Elusimicrobia bacterium RIFOXYB2_FULL_50_12]